MSRRECAVAEGFIELAVIVDLNVIRRNLRRIRTLTGGKLLFMVKANAYGHGITEVARATCTIADMFGVATVDEGVLLRERGIENDILVAVCSPEELSVACAYNLTIGLSDRLQMAKLVELSRNGEVDAKDVKIHLKLDTGMHRLGFEQSELDNALATLCDGGFKVQGVYSHLRDIDEKQIIAFERMSSKVIERFPYAVKHLASSHSLCKEDIHYDMVRVGLYGYSGAMSVVSRVLKVRRIRAGEHISYGDYVVPKDTVVAIVFGGYADGVLRYPPSKVCIRGKELDIIGNVCMDMFAVDCGEFVPQIGECVVLQGLELPLTEIAKQRDTIEYTVLTAWNGRAQRIYFDDKGTGKEFCKS